MSKELASEKMSIILIKYKTSTSSASVYAFLKGTAPKILFVGFTWLRLQKSKRRFFVKHWKVLKLVGVVKSINEKLKPKV